MTTADVVQLPRLGDADQLSTWNDQGFWFRMGDTAISRFAINGPSNVVTHFINDTSHLLEDRQQPVFCRQGGPPTCELAQQWQAGNSGPTKMRQ